VSFVETEVYLEHRLSGEKSKGRALIDLSLVGHFYETEKGEVMLLDLFSTEICAIAMEYKIFKNIFMKFKQPTKLEGN
jgi:hypothetical protein